MRAAALYGPALTGDERDRFVREQHRAILQVSASPAELLARMDAWLPTAAPKWVDHT